MTAQECLSSYLHDRELFSSPAYFKQIKDSEKKYVHASLNPKRKQGSTPLVLPVVFHILEDDSPDDFTEEDAIVFLDRLNEAFANLPPFDTNTGIQTQIEFCLA